MSRNKDPQSESNIVRASVISGIVSFIILGGIFLYSAFATPDSYSKFSSLVEGVASSTVQELSKPKHPPLDTKAYDAKMLSLANLPLQATSTATSTASSTPRKSKWPVKNLPYPKDGAILPFNRIVAYYGNFYSTRMGVLGEYEPAVVLQKLRAEVERWEAADPWTPVVPAIHYIVTVAQGTAGTDGDWTSRMPDTEVQKAIALAKEANAIVFLDVQPGQSTVQKEVAAISDYLKLPQVHLGIDPEFTMKGGRIPGEYIGSVDASEVNDVIAMLSKIVDDHQLSPKVLVIHRFTEKMVTNSHLIQPTKQVQVAITMDGWGTPELKAGIYRQVVASEPVQFTGIKLFYKNDLKAPSSGLLTPESILKWSPQPSYVQYQ